MFEEFLDRLKYAAECATVAGGAGAALGSSFFGAVSSVGGSFVGPVGTVFGATVGSGAGGMVGGAAGGFFVFFGGMLSYNN